jgi:hypothetical protein
MELWGLALTILQMLANRATLLPGWRRSIREGGSGRIEIVRDLANACRAVAIDQRTDPRELLARWIIAA